MTEIAIDRLTLTAKWFSSCEIKIFIWSVSGWIRSQPNSFHIQSSWTISTTITDWPTHQFNSVTHIKCHITITPILSSSLLFLAQLRYERLPWVHTETSLEWEDLCKTESSIAGSLLETKPTYLEYLETICVNSYVTQIWVVLNLRTCGCESAWAYLNIFVELNVLSRVVTRHMFQILRKKDKQECC